MKCPNCGTQLHKDNMYCEVCGEEIHIVPDFEPEIENSINETLTTVALDVSPSNFDADEDNPFEKMEIKEIPKHSRMFLMITIIIFFLFCVGAIMIGSIIYKDNSSQYQEKNAKAAYDNGNFEEAIQFYEKAIELEDNVRYKVELADCYLQLEKLDKAEDIYRDIILLEQSGENISYIQLSYAQLVYIYETEKKYDLINNLLVESKDETIQNEFQSYMAKEPEFTYEAGEYDEVIPLKLIAPSFGKIYYTLNGTTPGTGSLIYTAPIFLKKGIYTVRAVYINDFGISSNIVEKTYDIQAKVPQEPVISIDSGQFTQPQLISVTVPLECNVYYTTDGSAPTENSSIYGEPIPMPIGASNYKFVSISQEGVSSEVVRKSYNLTLESKYGPNDAINNVKNRLVEINHLLDNEGNLENMSGKNIYVYNCLRYIDNKSLYFIYEYYQEGNASRNMTGNVFAVDVMEGRVYKAVKAEDGSYSIEAI